MNDMHNFGPASLPNQHFADDQLEEHLSDDQLDDHLLGDLAAAPAAHLAACALCNESAALAAAPIASFQAVSIAWSERRSATMPLPVLTGHGPVWQRRMVVAMSAFAFAAGVALTNVSHKASVSTASAEAAPASTQTAPLVETASNDATPQLLSAGADRISADNRMLKAIDTELDASADSASPATLGLEAVSDRQPSAMPSVQNPSLPNPSFQN